MSRSQPPFRFSLTLDGFADDLQVLSFSGTEAISTPYAFELVLVSERSDLDLVALLHTPPPFWPMPPRVWAFTGTSIHRNYWDTDAHLFDDQQCWPRLGFWPLARHFDEGQWPGAHRLEP